MVGAAVLSHWVLDFIVHRPDLQLCPGGQTRVGLGLWNSWPATIAVEVLCFGAGLWIYARCTRARDNVGRYGFWALHRISFLWLGEHSVCRRPAERNCSRLGRSCAMWLTRCSWGMVGGQASRDCSIERTTR